MSDTHAHITLALMHTFTLNNMNIVIVASSHRLVLHPTQTGEVMAVLVVVLDMATCTGYLVNPREVLPPRHKTLRWEHYPLCLLHNL